MNVVVQEISNFRMAYMICRWTALQDFTKLYGFVVPPLPELTVKRERHYEVINPKNNEWIMSVGKQKSGSCVSFTGDLTQIVGLQSKPGI